MARSPEAVKQLMSHNKFMRRYNRHKAKHREYFEALASEVLQDGEITVQLGAETVEVVVHRKFPLRRMLEISMHGTTFRTVDMTNYENPVAAISEYLMQTAADIPGVVVPPAE